MGLWIGYNGLGFLDLLLAKFHPKPFKPHFPFISVVWGGWIIQGKQYCVYFAGDTGYDGTFLEIGKRFPHIDVALLPIGAYDPEWFMQAVHLNPEEATQAFIDSKANYMVPIHWGTFKLSDEPLDEPTLRFKSEIKRGSPRIDHYKKEIWGVIVQLYKYQQGLCVGKCYNIQHDMYFVV